MRRYGVPSWKLTWRTRDWRALWSLLWWKIWRNRCLMGGKAFVSSFQSKCRSKKYFFLRSTYFCDDSQPFLKHQAFDVTLQTPTGCSVFFTHGRDTSARCFSNSFTWMQAMAMKWTWNVNVKVLSPFTTQRKHYLDVETRILAKCRIATQLRQPSHSKSSLTCLGSFVTLHAFQELHINGELSSSPDGRQNLHQISAWRNDWIGGFLK